jgi:hypothetical protein
MKQLSMPGLEKAAMDLYISIVKSTSHVAGRMAAMVAVGET